MQGHKVDWWGRQQHKVKVTLFTYIYSRGLVYTISYLISAVQKYFIYEFSEERDWEITAQPALVSKKSEGWKVFKLY